ncbi:trimeric intracellular cation channel type B isoform X1 [Stigmatopora argus]
MDSLDELSHALAGLSMFPFFDMAHYLVSIMALRGQPGAVEVSRESPLACWFSSMLQCFGGAVLSGIMLAEPPVEPLSNGTNVLLASVLWYLVFYCPWNLAYKWATFPPLHMVLSGMKEVTRTWKVLGGITQARGKYQDGLLVMIAIGWARGAGSGLIGNFEQLVRGVWRPETNELLKMSYPTKVTLIGAVLFALQQTQYLPLQTHHLMLIYTTFTVLNKTRIMLSGSATSSFGPIESALQRTLFTGFSPYPALAGTNNGSAGAPTEEPPANRASGSPQTKDKSAKKSQ